MPKARGTVRVSFWLSSWFLSSTALVSGLSPHQAGSQLPWLSREPPRGLVFRVGPSILASGPEGDTSGTLKADGTGIFMVWVRRNSGWRPRAR